MVFSLGHVLSSEESASPKGKIKGTIADKNSNRPLEYATIALYNADDNTLNSIIENDQILFKYCDSSGCVSRTSNPNGSIMNIAGICNEDRNVFGMMPHPERASDVELFNLDGSKLFESIFNFSHLLIRGLIKGLKMD